jgi:Ca-activated chloride channel family protein
MKKRWMGPAILAFFTAVCGGGGSNVGFGGVQDIGQYRAIVEAGGIPGPDTLDANDFFNQHHIELPDPDCGQDLCAGR